MKDGMQSWQNDKLGEGSDVIGQFENENIISVLTGIFSFSPQEHRF